MVGGLDPQRVELVDQLGAPGDGEGRRDADVLQLAVGVVQAEEEGAEQRLLVGRGLVEAVAGDDDVGGADVLDLDHRPAVGLVGAGHAAWRRRRRVQRPRTCANQSSAVVEVGGRRGEVDRRLARSASACSSCARRSLCGASSSDSSPSGQQVEGDERRRGLLGQHPHPRVGRVDPLEQPLELEPAVDRRR